MKTEKKSKKETKVLIVALGVAAVTVAGSTFAWFTSKDEVTNRLSASASYGVSITEDFTPPSNWVPGQEVKKEVSVINTGNLPAYAKLELKGAFNIETETANGEEMPQTDAAHEDIKNGKLNGHKLAELNAKEITSLQAGGYLAYKPATYDVTTGTMVEGLYLYRREIKDVTEGGQTTEKYDYTGYYYCEHNQKYYALKTQKINDEYSMDVLTNMGQNIDEEVDKIRLRSYEEKVITADDTQLTWDYTKAGAPDEIVTVTYHPTGATDTKKDVKINIKLDNIGDNTTTTNTWFIVDTTNKCFYYNGLLPSGDTTANLVKSVELDESVKQEAFSAMDFDLTVMLESIQADKDENDKYTNKTITSLQTGATVDPDNGKPIWKSSTT